MAEPARLIADWQRAQQGKFSFVERVAYIALLASNPMPVTRFGPKRDGTLFPAAAAVSTGTFVQLYQNPLPRPVSVVVEAAFTTPGARVRLSRQPGGGDADQVDELANAGAPPNAIRSGTIILDPKDFLYAADITPGVALGATDTLRVLIFDPMKHVEKPF